MEVQAELLPAALAGVPPARDEAVPWVRVPVEPVARDAKAEAQAGLLAEVLADAPPVQDEAVPWARVLVALVAARAELLVAVLADGPRVRDEAERWVSVPDEPVALDEGKLPAWIPAVELARPGAAERDDSPAFEPARDVAPSSGSQAPAELAAIRAAGIVAERAGFRELA